MSIILSMALLLAADQPPGASAPSAPANVPTQTASTTGAAAPAEQPKMVCKYEFDTGSRVTKTKVCRPANEPQGPDSKLQRQLDRNGDFVEAPSTFGN